MAAAIIVPKFGGTYQLRGLTTGGGGGGSSVWGDHGTNVARSTTAQANDTASGLANSFSSVRGTLARSAGLYYFEVKFLTAPLVANFIIGLMDDTTATGSAMDDRILANSAGHVMFNGNLQASSWTGVNLAGAWTLADNDRMGVAADFTNGFYYLHKAASGAGSPTYFLSGDPTSGATGTGAVGNGARPNARPMLTLWGDNVGNPGFSGVAQLMTAASDLLYLPSGYTAWG